MKAANGRHVYKKLRTLYGNSFRTLIVHHTQHTFNEDSPDTELIRTQLLALNDTNILQSEISDSLEPAASIYQTNISELDEGLISEAVTNTDYLTDGYLYSGDCASSSEKVQRQIESLAQKVTRSIIDSKGFRR